MRWEGKIQNGEEGGGKEGQMGTKREMRRRRESGGRGGKERGEKEREESGV